MPYARCKVRPLMYSPHRSSPLASSMKILVLPSEADAFQSPVERASSFILATPGGTVLLLHGSVLTLLATLDAVADAAGVEAEVWLGEARSTRRPHSGLARTAPQLVVNGTQTPVVLREDGTLHPPPIPLLDGRRPPPLRTIPSQGGACPIMIPRRVGVIRRRTELERTRPTGGVQSLLRQAMDGIPLLRQAADGMPPPRQVVHGMRLLLRQAVGGMPPPLRQAADGVPPPLQQAMDGVPPLRQEVDGVCLVLRQAADGMRLTLLQTLVVRSLAMSPKLQTIPGESRRSKLPPRLMMNPLLSRPLRTLQRRCVYTSAATTLA